MHFYLGEDPDTNDFFYQQDVNEYKLFFMKEWKKNPEEDMFNKGYGWINTFNQKFGL